MSTTANRTGSQAKYVGLLASLLLMMLVAPIVAPRGALSVLTSLVFAFLLLFAVWSVSHRLKTTVIASVLAAMVFVGSLLAHWLELGATFGIAVLAVACLFFGYVTALVLRDVFLSTQVTMNTITGAICGYILLGMLWGYLYGIVDLAVPNAFSAAVGESDLIGRFVYFSMVTLTTLGYGDITPVAPAARGLAVAEATIGQIYLTVLVARLVGMHLSQKMGSNGD